MLGHIFGIKARCGRELMPSMQTGVLLLNAALTVQKDKANSHASIGWERFTDAIGKVSQPYTSISTSSIQR